MSQKFTTRGAFGSTQYGAFCPYPMDVTPDTSGTGTGISDYKALTFRECVYIYWMMKNIEVSGSASYSSSASMTGDYERITKTRQPDGSYITEVADAFSGTADPQSFNFTDTFKINSSYPYDQRVPVEPAKRVCRRVYNNGQLINNNISYSKELRENPYDQDSDRIHGDSGLNPAITAGTQGSCGLYYFYGYYVNDHANVVVECPSPKFFPAFDNGDFVGYVIKEFCKFDIHVFASGGGATPVSTSSARPISAVVQMGGFGGISSLLYSDKYGPWEGTQISSSVNFGGFDFFAQGLGGPFSISEGDGGVTFSSSDSKSDSNSYDIDTRDEDGAGIVYTGEGECEASASFNITFSDPTYWGYPS